MGKGRDIFYINPFIFFFSIFFYHFLSFFFLGLHFSDNERLFVVSMILHVCKRSGDADGLLQAADKYLAQVFICIYYYIS